jgi:hypothetical protein
MPSLLLRPALSLLLLVLVIDGCRRERPEQVPRPDSTSTSSADPAPSATTPLDTPRAQAPPSAAPSYWTGGTQAPEPTVEKDRREVLSTLDGFFTTISGGSEREFRSRLSTRSIEFLKTYDPDGSVWAIAKEALGTLGNRRTEFLGGRPDSAAVLVSGARAGGDTAMPGAIILSVLRENGEWKVMYPGAQPYDEHVGP